MPPLPLELLALLLGLLVGSFLNVCISRLPSSLSVVTPRSRCPACLHPIAWYDNLPVISWLLLRARCRACKRRISVRYPLIELAMAGWFVLAAYRIAPLLQGGTGPTLPVDTLLSAAIQTIAFLAVGFLLLGLAVMDWQHQVLPDTFTLGGIAIAVFLLACQALLLGPTDNQIRLSNHHIRLSSPGNVVEHGNLFFTGPEALLGGRLVAILAAALVPLAIRTLYRRIRGRDGMGLGDVKLMALLAAFLGFAPAALSFVLGVFTGGLYATALLLARRADGHSRIPFGTFLAAAGLVAASFGQEILGWYKSLL